MVLVDGGGHAEKGGAAEESAVDYRGNPADGSRTGGWLAAGLILGTELSERICVMGIAMNLVTYLVGDLHLSSSRSANVVTNFLGTLNLLGLVGGFVADAKLGRYLTVAISASIAAIGVSLLTLATSIPSMKPPRCDDSRTMKSHCIEASGGQLALLFIALNTIAVGGGGIKSNVSGFGSDQFDSSNPKERNAMIYFFNRFYFCISLGSLFAVTVLVYVQDNVGRGLGYGMSAGTMVVAVTVLVAGMRRYRFKKPQGSPLSVVWRVMFLAWKRRNVEYPAHPSSLHEFHNAKVQHTPRLRCLDKAAVVEEHGSCEGRRSNPWIVCTVSEVEEVKMVLKLLPIWSTCILFWTVYSQMNTFTIEQATIMNRYIGTFQIPAASFSVFLFLTILLVTSLNEWVTVPLARRFTRSPQGITSLQRVGVGLLLSILGMVAAGAVEKHRRESAVNHSVKIRAFWLIPQFFIIGAGEAFAYVGQLEFFIREAPEGMKSMSTGLFLSTLSMGFFVSSVLVVVVGKASKGDWLKSNLNIARLDYFYWMLAVLGVVNFSVFAVFATRHRYKAQLQAGMAEEELVKTCNQDNEKESP